MKKLYVLVLALVSFSALFAQQGEIAGTVVDEKGEPAYPVNVILVDETGKSTGVGTQVDFDGKYSIKPLNPGTYNVQVSALGYNSQRVQGVRVSAGGTTFQNFKLAVQSQEITTVEVVRYKNPLIDKAKTSNEKKLTDDDIKSMPTRDITELVTRASGVQKTSSGVSIRGARPNSTVYYVDGVKVMGDPGIPTDGIGELGVLTGGVPAEFGDVTGGAVVITTKKPLDNFSGSASVQNSYGLDPFGFLLANATLRGPLIKTKKDKDGNRRTLLSFSSSFEYQGRKDANPSPVGVWQVKEEKLNEIRQNPLIKLTDGFILSSENVSYKDMYKSAIRPNNADQSYRGSLSFDLSPVNGVTISLGGSANYRKYRQIVDEYTLFNSENNPERSDLNYRAFVRFSHNLDQTKKSKDGKEEKGKNSYFKNAYYSVQVDFEKFKRVTQDDSHKDKFFDYGFIGNFKTKRARSFTLDDTVTVNGITYKGIIQNGWSDTSVLFKPGTANVYGTRFTEQYYQALGGVQDGDGYYEVLGGNKTGFTQNTNQINGNYGGLINGKRSEVINDLWYNIGRQYNGYSVDRNDEQYRARGEFSFDLQKPGSSDLNRHSIKLGIEFEHRVQRRFSVNPLQLYEKMQLLVNSHLKLDRANPTFYINGVAYDKNSPELANFGTGLNGSAGINKDSVIFAYTTVDSAQSVFDKNFRAQHNLSATDYIDIFNYSPDQFNLNMFSAEELLSPIGSSTIINARGYDYTGKVLTSNPTIDDFFNAKDANGKYTRLQGAFTPTYAAGYIQDKFYYKNLGFLLGVRVDYYNANQYVLKDPYSLYAIKTAKDVTAINGNTITHPNNIGSDFAVYVDDFSNPSQVVGYRNGDQWYNASGEALASVAELSNSSGLFVPYKVDKTADVLKNFDYKQSFEKYKAQWNVMPRIQVSFNVNDKSQFFAHYDMLTQRPGGNNAGDLRNALNLVDYLYWNQLDAVRNNPALKPERTIDFEFGFKQVLSKFASATLSAYYKEFRDMLQWKKYQGAFPSEYITYSNVDFGNTKGVSLALDFRRYMGFKVDFNYTLQFSEGTGSDDGSQRFLVTANSPNFRNVFPLNYDSRHTINTTLDLRFGKSDEKNEFINIKNPVVAKILNDFGFNFTFTARSGMPYTGQTLVTGEGFISGLGRANAKGSVNGLRKPFVFEGNLRVDKSFPITMKDKSKENAGSLATAKKKLMDVGVFLMVENLFNLANVENVYRFTGSATDDGFLGDPSSTIIISNYRNPNAFVDQYRTAVNNPSNFGLARRIYIGAKVTF